MDKNTDSTALASSLGSGTNLQTDVCGTQPTIPNAACLGYAEKSCQAEHALLDGTETILLVEDEAFVRLVTKQVLASAGYKVLSASNAGEALRIYEECSAPIDVLLTDVILPGETGRSLAKRLRAKNSSLKVLLVTGYAAQMEASDLAGEPDCLPKPFSAKELLLKIRQVLDGKSAQPLALGHARWR